MLLGQHYARQNEPDRAMLYYERAASIDAFEAHAKVRHAQVLVTLGRYADAIPLLRRAQESSRARTSRATSSRSSASPRLGVESLRSCRRPTDAAGSRRTWALALLLVVATLLAYLPALRAGTIWDDDWYLTENPYLDDLAGLGRLWIPGSTPQYYPAVFTTFWIEKHVWDLAPAATTS
jgi:tetratricopeptide (TPR) repeat protein